jgi:hypothetical protein
MPSTTTTTTTTRSLLAVCRRTIDDGMLLLILDVATLIVRVVHGYFAEREESDVACDGPVGCFVIMCVYSCCCKTALLALRRHVMYGYTSSSKTLKCTDCCNKPGRDPIVARHPSTNHSAAIRGRKTLPPFPTRVDWLAAVHEMTRAKPRVNDRVDTTQNFSKRAGLSPISKASFSPVAIVVPTCTIPSPLIIPYHRKQRELYSESYEPH